MTRRPPKAATVRHLLVRTGMEIGGVERFRGYCGANGITKRLFTQDAELVDCEVCKSKLKGKLK